jgi:hypothetical protein
VPTDVLSDRALGRATLARQLLLERTSVAPTDALTHLVGLQAQNPLDPYLALWSRLDRFDPVELGGLVESRAVVRLGLLRATIHLVTADDALSLHPIVAPVLAALVGRHRDLSPYLVGVDLDPVVDVARGLLSDTAMTGPQLQAMLAGRFPDLHAAALVHACRCLLPLVQVPPRGVWGARAQAPTLFLLDAWVGRRRRDPSARAPDELVLRYLRAFGPASVADVTTWSRLTGLREVVERLRPQLRRFTDERGRELFDVDDAPRPDGDAPAPVRYLPEYDNVLLSHADRSRFGVDAIPGWSSFERRAKGTVLVDGQLRAIWRADVDRRARRVTFTVEHASMTKRHRSQVEAEGRRVAGFLHAESDHDVRLVPL